MKKVNSSGQVTVFIIVAVVIFLAVSVGALFFIKDNKTVKEFINRNSVSSEIMPVYESIDSCVEQRAIDAIRIVGLQGGYVILPKNSFDVGIFSTSYGYSGGGNLLPDRGKVEKEINRYMELTVPFCYYNSSDQNVTFGKAASKTKINRDFIYVSLTMPVSINSSGRVASLDKEYIANLEYNLGDMLDVANKIIEKQKISNGYIPASYLTSFNYNTVFYMFNDSVVYTIVDNSTTKNGEPYNFVFAAKLK